MSFAYTPYTLPFIASSIITIVLCFFIYPFRNEVATKVFGGLLIAIFLWSAGFVLEIMGVELSTKILFANIQFLGITAIPITFLALARNITGRGQKLRFVLYILAVFYVVTNILIWTNDLHHWFRQSPRLDTASETFTILVNDYGFWFYYVQVPIYYSAYMITLFTIIQGWRFSSVPFRRQAGILFFSFALPFLVDIFYVIGISPIPNFNFTSAAFGISGALIAFALYQYRLFDIVPMANDLIVRNFSEGVIVLNLQNRVIEINPSACEIIHTDPANAIGMPVTNVLWFAREINFDPGIDQRTFTLRHNETDGIEHYYDVTLQNIKNSRRNMVGTLITILDVSERQLSIMKTRILATTDSLTGVFNRRHFFELLELEVSKASQLSQAMAVIMLDIDDFKHFNDQYGHAVGDKILTRVTQTCQTHLRNFDLLGRYGGDEFIALLPQANSELAKNVATRLCQLISSLEIIVNANTISLTVSIGVAGYSGEGHATADKLLQLADAAMYQAKESGKNRVSVIDFNND